MKSLIAAALLIVSVSSFGADTVPVLPGSVESLLSVLPLGTHSGKDDSGVDCSIVVTEVSYPSKALSVVAMNLNNRIFKIVTDGSEFSFRSHNKEFIQAERHYVDSTRTSFVDRVIRTVDAGDNRLYTVVANETTVNRDRTVEAVECVVAL